MKPKRVFALALRYTIVTALDHLQWRVITPTLSSFKQTLFPQKKQACIKIHSVVSFGERHGFYTSSAGGPFCGIFMQEHHNAHTFNSKPHDSELNTIYTQVEPTNHIEKEMEV